MFLFIVGLFSSENIFAAVMQSTNWQIESDSINIGGTEDGASASYRMRDTAGEIATGSSLSASYRLDAGYRQMQEVYLALTSAADVSLSPSIGGITGGTSDGNASVTATTDSAGGYELSIVASSSPALVHDEGGASIADYAPGVVPSYTFSYAAHEAVFAYSPEGVDIATRFKNSGSTCGSGSSDDVDKCWDGLSTSETIIASRTSSNHPSGTATTIKFKVGIGTGVNQTPGTYTATTTLTLVAL